MRVDSENGSPYNPKEFNPNIWLKSRAAELGLKTKQLLAMAPQRDPFNFGTQTDWIMARWFKGCTTASAIQVFTFADCTTESRIWAGAK